MRLPRVRITIRRMMIAVMVVGIAIAGYVESSRWLRTRAEYRRQAAYHVRMVELYRGLTLIADRGKAAASQAAATQEQQVAKVTADERRAQDPARRDTYFQIALHAHEWHDYWAGMIVYYDRVRTGYRDLADYHGQLALKYDRAAGRPWSSVVPDPPEPKDPERDHTIKEPERPSLQPDR